MIKKYIRLRKAARVFLKRADSVRTLADSIYSEARLTKNVCDRTSLYWAATGLFYSSVRWYNKSSRCNQTLASIHYAIAAAFFLIAAINYLIH